MAIEVKEYSTIESLRVEGIEAKKINHKVKVSKRYCHTSHRSCLKMHLPDPTRCHKMCNSEAETALFVNTLHLPHHFYALDLYEAIGQAAAQEQCFATRSILFVYPSQNSVELRESIRKIRVQKMMRLGASTGRLR
jgi:hypothetical protein